MIPGSNLLNLALGVIGSQSVTYYRYASRSLNDVAQDVAVYEDPITLTGSFQPLSRKLYQMYGLDLQKSYYVFYVSADVIDVERDVSGDQLVFNNKRYQCESNDDWYVLDGWKGVLCVYISEDS